MPDFDCIASAFRSCCPHGTLFCLLCYALPYVPIIQSSWSAQQPAFLSAHESTPHPAEQHKFDYPQAVAEPSMAIEMSMLLLCMKPPVAVSLHAYGTADQFGNPATLAGADDSMQLLLLV